MGAGDPGLAGLPSLPQRTGLCSRGLPSVRVWVLTSSAQKDTRDQDFLLHLMRRTERMTKRIRFPFRESVLFSYLPNLLPFFVACVRTGAAHTTKPFSQWSTEAPDVCPPSLSSLISTCFPITETAAGSHVTSTSPGLHTSPTSPRCISLDL